MMESSTSTLQLGGIMGEVVARVLTNYRLETPHSSFLEYKKRAGWDVI